MRNPISNSRTIEKLFFIIIIIIFFTVLLLAESYNYLLFHSLAEFFSISVAFVIFTIAWSSRDKMDNMYLLFIGISYLFIGFIDLLHTLSYKGMNIFTDYEFYANQLWIAARYIESLSLAVAFIFLSKKNINVILVFIIYTVITILVILSIFIYKIFPVCFIANEGQTAFKIISEYIIIFILLLVGIFYYKYRYKFDKRVSQFLILSIIATVLSELSFTFYIRNYDILNQIGHILKIISFYFIYTSIVTTGINKPENIIYRELNLTNKKLKETLSKLELSNKELEQFSYVVAHDLKNPLAVIISGMRILKNYYSKHNDDHSIEIINSVDKTANRMSQMINHLLDYSKIHKNQANYSIIEVKDILHMAMDNLKVLIDDTQAIITYDKLPKIKCDKILMISLFQNLISNALKYRRKDIIPKIHIGVLEQEHHYLFSVSDNGIGINSKFLEKIFMIFTRINDDKDTNEGHGIGLAYCKKIVEKHNGKIWVESKINEGSTFYFTILK